MVLQCQIQPLTMFLWTLSAVVRPHCPSPPWLDGEVLQSLRAKEWAFQKKRAFPSAENIAAFEVTWAFFKKLAGRKSCSYFATPAGGFGKNPKGSTVLWMPKQINTCYHQFPNMRHREQTQLTQPVKRSNVERLLPDCLHQHSWWISPHPPRNSFIQYDNCTSNFHRQ